MFSIQWVGGSQPNPAFGPVNASVKLGQPWSNLVKVGQTSPNSRKCAPDPILRLFWCGGSLSGLTGSAWAALFCVPTPEKILGVKIGLWQLPLLCLAFLGTRKVGKRINDSIFAYSNFLDFRACLPLSRSLSQFACQSFRPPKRHSRGRRRSDEIRKGGVWLEVAIWCEKGTPAARDGTARGPTLKRVARPFFFIFSFFSSFSPFGPHFAPAFSFAHILQSETSIDDLSSPTRYTSKHLPILTIFFSFERSKCATLVVLFFMSFCSFLAI